MLGSWSQGGFLPYTTMADRNWGRGKVRRLFIRAIGWEDVPPLVKIIPQVVREDNGRLAEPDNVASLVVALAR